MTSISLVYLKVLDGLPRLPDVLRVVVGPDPGLRESLRKALDLYEYIA